MSTLPITVITASLPHRSAMLERAAASVEAQTLAPVAHRINVDASISVAEARNRLLAETTTPWVAFLDDDDVLDPHHLEMLAARASADDLDVVIPHCRFEGEPLPGLACCPGYYNRPFVLEDLRQHGIFPLTVLARVAAMDAAGNFPPDKPFEDWSLWNTMADMGSSFEVVPVVTWTYFRGHPSRTSIVRTERRRRRQN